MERKSWFSVASTFEFFAMLRVSIHREFFHLFSFRVFALTYLVFFPVNSLDQNVIEYGNCRILFPSLYFTILFSLTLKNSIGIFTFKIKTYFQPSFHYIFNSNLFNIILREKAIFIKCRWRKKESKLNLILFYLICSVNCWNLNIIFIYS